VDHRYSGTRKEKKKKKRTQTIEPFNRDIDEHEMHLKHKKKQTEMHNFQTKKLITIKKHSHYA